MTTNMTTKHPTRPVCTQPGCLLKRKGFRTHHLANVLTKTLAGEHLESIICESERILNRPQCTDCVLRVMEGLKAYLTEDEWDHLDALGHWHHRRQRRRLSGLYQSH